VANPAKEHAVEREARRVLAALERRKREHPIDFYQPSPKQEAFHRAPQRKRFFGGANRLGKTTGGTIEVEWFALGTHPYRKIETPNIGWIVTLDSNVSAQVNWPKIKEWFTRGLCTYNERQGVIEWKNGSTTYIKSCDSGEEKFQGAGLRYIYFDEEPPEKIYQECMARVAAGQRLDVWVTATLLHGLTYIFSEYIEPVNELAAKGEVHPDVFAVTGGIADNPNFSEEERRAFASSFKGDEYKVRVEGEIIQMGLDSVVSEEEIARHERDDVRPPDAVGTFIGQGRYGTEFQERADGVVRLWVDRDSNGRIRRPEAWRRYGGGWDPSGGRGGDDSVFQLYDVSTREKVCTIRTNRLPPSQLAPIVAGACWFFNNALINPEVNSLGLAAVDALRNLGVRMYTKTYKDRRSETLESEKVGFTTGDKTRDYLIEQYLAALPGLKVRDATTVDEWKTFVRTLTPTGKVKYAARRGKKDDSLMADMLALECLRQVPIPAHMEQRRKTDFERMMVEQRRKEKTVVSSLGGY
jgi:phage terminase large subunit-like protein